MFDEFKNESETPNDFKIRSLGEIPELSQDKELLESR